MKDLFTFSPDFALTSKYGRLNSFALSCASDFQTFRSECKSILFPTTIVTTSFGTYF